MTRLTAVQTVDLMVVIVANAINLLMVGIFLSRRGGMKQYESALGLVMIVLALPLAGAAAANAAAGRSTWLVALPLPMILFCAVELLLDYALKLDFRSTRWLWPYLVLYYVALFGMIGYAFLAGRPYGFFTLGTYFLNLWATWYAYARVGHGYSHR